MRYFVDVKTNPRFVQIFGATDALASMESPLAFQIRGGRTLLECLRSVCERCIAKVRDIDLRYHDDPTARFEFEGGFVIFEPGDLPITCIVRRRVATLVLGGQQVGSDAVQLEALMAAVDSALADK